MDWGDEFALSPIQSNELHPHIRPISYEIVFRPDLHKSQVTGTETILLNILEAKSDNIRIHALNVNITSASLILNRKAESEDVRCVTNVHCFSRDLCD
jgi:hypothetical protein